tara:strand:+ start:147 stop:2207 length:2061 start_codon:yes stop_codon:yes gene_type:complete
MGFLSSLFGVSDRTPSTQTVVQSSKVPSELAPYVNQISEEAQTLYEGQVGRGYNPYTGQTIAPLTVEEQEAMSGIAGLSGTTAPYIQEALGTYREGAEQFTGDTAQQYMSPYQQAVTDIELRESQNQFDTQVMPQFEAKAASMGAGSGLGTRAGVQAAELQRGQSQLLADIQAKGSQRAFQDARIGFEAQKARENQMAANVGRTGPALFQAGLAEQGALQGVGEAKRQLGQSALDESYAKFLSEENYPQQTLANYSNTIYGNPVLGTPSMTRSTSGTPGAASTAQQLLGLGLTGLNMYGAGTAGGQNFSFGNMASTMYNRPRAAGGQVGGGLPTIHRANGGGGLGDDEQGFPMESDENIGRFIRETEDIPYRGQPTMSNSMQGPVNFYQGINKAINDLSVRSLESKNIATKLNTDVSAANIAANKRQTNLTDNFLNKKEAAIKRKSEAYPFASIQKGIAAGMKETTISEMFTQGIAVGGAELEKKANELANMVDALENKKFGAKSKQEAEQSARLLENLKGDANLQLKLLGQDTKTQLEILKLMAQGLNYKAALAKANKGNKLKLTTAILSDKSDAINSALGFKGDFKVDAAGNSNYVGKRADGGDLTDVDVQKIARYNVIWSTVYSNADSKGLDGVAASALAQDAVIKQHQKDSTSLKVNTPPPPGTKPVASPSTTAQTLTNPIQ